MNINDAISIMHPTLNQLEILVKNVCNRIVDEAAKIGYDAIPGTIYDLPETVECEVNFPKGQVIVRADKQTHLLTIEHIAPGFLEESIENVSILELVREYAPNPIPVLGNDYDDYED